MRVKRLTGLLPAIISTALQVSLKTEGAPHPPGSIPLLSLPASLGCHEFVSAQPVTGVKPVAGFGIFLTPCYNHPGCGFGRGVCVSGGIPMDTSPPLRPPLPPWSLWLCLQSGSAASLGGRLETAAAGCHSDGAFAQHPSIPPTPPPWPKLGERKKSQGTPALTHPPPPGSGWQARGWGN